MAGGIRKTLAGNWQAYWRDPVGRQTSKTFRTKREAAAFLAQMTTAASTGGYVSPHAVEWTNARPRACLGRPRGLDCGHADPAPTSRASTRDAELQPLPSVITPYSAGPRIE
jgi:hypothetical protein